MQFKKDILFLIMISFVSIYSMNEGQDPRMLCNNTVELKIVSDLALTGNLFVFIPNETVFSDPNFAGQIQVDSFLWKKGLNQEPRDLENFGFFAKEIVKKKKYFESKDNSTSDSNVRLDMDIQKANYNKYKYNANYSFYMRNLHICGVYLIRLMSMFGLAFGAVIGLCKAGMLVTPSMFAESSMFNNEKAALPILAGALVVGAGSYITIKWLDKNAQYRYRQYNENERNAYKTIVKAVYTSNEVSAAQQHAWAKSVSELYNYEYSFYKSYPTSYPRSVEQEEVNYIKYVMHSAYLLPTDSVQPTK